MAVGALQERRIAMTGEVCDRIFVHAFVQKRRDEEMPERVQMVWSANCVSFLHPNAIGLWTTTLTSASWSFFRDFQMFQPFSRP